MGKVKTFDVKKNMKTAQDFQDLYNKPIRVTDAASMCRKKINKNDRPYNQTVIRLNNKKVDEWQNRVLIPMSNKDGTVPSGQVWDSFIIFNEGIEIREMVKHGDFLPHMPDKVVDYWKKIFETYEVEELHALGTGVVSQGWNVVINAIKYWIAIQKYERIFSKSDDPHVWVQSMARHKGLLQGQETPFWDPEHVQEYTEKVVAILTNKMEPEKFQALYNKPIRVTDAASMCRKKINKNDKPYNQIAIRLNNKKVDDWENRVLVPLSNKDGTVPSGQVWDSFIIFNEGIEIREMVKHGDFLPHMPDKVVDYWKKIFETYEVEDLHALGTGVMSQGWNVVINAIKYWIAIQKYERIFSNSDDPFDWVQSMTHHKGLLQGQETPFWDPEHIQEYTEKVVAILTNKVEPEN